MDGMLPNIHPGEILLDDFLAPAGISPALLARQTALDVEQIEQVILKQRAVSPDIDESLSAYFGTSAGYWLRLQEFHDQEAEKRAPRPL